MPGWNEKFGTKLFVYKVPLSNGTKSLKHIPHNHAVECIHAVVGVFQDSGPGTWAAFQVSDYGKLWRRRIVLLNSLYGMLLFYHIRGCELTGVLCRVKERGGR
ncbi:hypothetical protein RRG08_026998 [Elysia crispata]|uniref:Uncharacterized protein n=1 Tax=Elysia crispata TaxID=231223 RepID=A0AAE1DZ30_9GAST|nr:hypothetical protein RRG08_026998 [Elysia crispata]